MKDAEDNERKNNEKKGKSTFFGIGKKKKKEIDSIENGHYETHKVERSVLYKKLVRMIVIPIIGILVLTFVICDIAIQLYTVNSSKKDVLNEVALNGAMLDSYLNQYLSLLDKSQNMNQIKMLIQSQGLEHPDENSLVYQNAIAGMEQIKTLSEGYEGSKKPVIFLIDKNSNALLEDETTGEIKPYKDSSFSLTKRPWYNGIKENTHAYLTEPYENQLDKENVVSVIMPLRNDTTNELVGVLGVDFYVEYLSRIMDRTEFLKNGYFSLLSSDGTLLYYPDKNRIMQQGESLKELHNVRESMIYVTDVKGEKSICGVYRMKETNWYMCGVMSMKEVRIQAWSLIFPIGFIFLTSVLMLYVVMKKVSEIITAPITKLKLGMENIARGNYKYKLPMESDDEIGHLASTFNKTVEDLWIKSEVDSLTGIFTMNALLSRAERMIYSQREKRYAILVLNLNHFKFINNMFGRDEGDNILIYVATVLKKNITKEGVFGRWKDDVFCIFTSYEHTKELEELADSLVKQIKAYSKVINVSASCGISEVTDTSLSLKNYVDYANMAIENIKDNVFVNYLFYDKELHRKMRLERKLENEMEVALMNHQFDFYLQAKYNMNTLEVVGAEALVRWMHPLDGMISPGKFVPLFEKNGFIIKLDEYIWEKVCESIHGWLLKGYDIVPISINISRIHIMDPSFVDRLVSLVKQYDIPTKYLELEFTESAFLDGVDELYEFMEKLRAKGFRLAMDDFGSGYSSLNMLKNVPLDVVKIDKEFINETVVTERGKTIVENTIALVNKLDMDLVAEGVENEPQAKFLMEAGCIVAQGFLYAKPVPVEVFEQIAFHQRREFEPETLSEIRRKKRK